MTAEPLKRYAAIDIGTVTCRLLIADANSYEMHEVAKGMAITDLGEGVDASGVLKPEAIGRVRTAVIGFKQIISSYTTPDHPRIEVIALATSASRDARNSDEFISMLADIGITLSVITGEEEAALSFLGASSAFPNEPLLVVDIGGGSTELIAGSTKEGITQEHSFDIGCRRVTDRFFRNDPPSTEELAAAYVWAKEGFESFFDELDDRGFVFKRIVAVAGTATTVVSVHERMDVYDSAKVHASVINRSGFEEVYRDLCSVSLEQRKQIVGLDPRRAGVIVAGMVIIDAVLELSGQDSFTVSEFDILHGIIQNAVSENIDRRG